MDNVLLDSEMDAKVTDFGFARIAWDHVHHQVLLSETSCGTPIYFSPQLHKRELYNPFLADSWASGIMLYAMLHNNFPFDSDDVDEIVENMNDYPDYIEEQIDDSISSDCVQLLLGMLNPKENGRFTLHHVLQSDWLKSSVIR